MTLETERFIAIKAVAKACRLCEAVRSSLPPEGSILKKDSTPVTVADFASQALIIMDLTSSFNYPVMAEEEGSALQSAYNRDIKLKVLEYVDKVYPGLSERKILAAINRSNCKGGPTGRFWALDPLDGTKGFLRNEQYAIALALIEDGEVVLGILGCPNLPVDVQNTDDHTGCLFIAVRGRGTVTRSLDDPKEEPIVVTDIDDPSRAVVCESVESSHSSQTDSHKIREILKIQSPPIRMDSQCKYGLVARGDSSIYLRLPTSSEYVENLWDHAAGWIVVEEAGGRVTDVFGNPVDFSIGQGLERNKGIVATNGKLHGRVISTLARVIKKND
jgi:3'(2'), 5'-bisphosphate nucleotidase